MPTPVGPNTTGPDWTDVTACIRSVESLHKVDVTYHLCSVPLGGIGELGVVLEAQRRDGTLSAGEALSLIRAGLFPTTMNKSLPAMLLAMLYELDGFLSRVLWEQLKLDGLEENPS